MCVVCVTLASAIALILVRQNISPAKTDAAATGVAVVTRALLLKGTLTSHHELPFHLLIITSTYFSMVIIIYHCLSLPPPDSPCLSLLLPASTCFSMFSITSTYCY